MATEFEQALVLGGGGVAGIAWGAGMIAGLRAAGVDLSTADLIIGTSAGSVVGAHLAHGVDVPEAMDQATESAEGASNDLESLDMNELMLAFAAIFDPNQEPQQARMRLGELAVQAKTAQRAHVLPELTDRLPSREWPDRKLLITAVDVADGAFRVWDRTSPASLAQAVQSSCTVPGVFPPVEIDGRLYMDGGTRSTTNADLAAGAAAVVVLEPLAHLTPREMLERELAALGDARTVAIGPDQAAVEVFGLNVMDPGLWGPAHAAGLAQAAAAAESIGAVWKS